MDFIYQKYTIKPTSVKVREIALIPVKKDKTGLKVRKCKAWKTSVQFMDKTDILFVFSEKIVFIPFFGFRAALIPVPQSVTIFPGSRPEINQEDG